MISYREYWIQTDLTTIPVWVLAAVGYIATVGGLCSKD